MKGISPHIKEDPFCHVNIQREFRVPEEGPHLTMWGPELGSPASRTVI